MKESARMVLPAATVASMDLTEVAPLIPRTGRSLTPRQRSARASLAIFLGCLVLYHLNGRPHAGFDTFAAPYTAWSLVRHGSLDLRPYEELRLCLGTHVKELPDGRWVSIRGPGSALVAVPVVAPLAMIHERPPSATTMHHLGKLAAAGCVAAAAVLFFGLCRRLAPSAAWPPTVLFALGTGLASVASQALWMHGPATLWLCWALVLLLPASEELTPLRAAGAGLALGLAILTRPTTAVFAVASGITLLTQRRWRAAGGLLLGGLIPAAFQVLLNYRFFGDPFVGGYGQENWTMPTPLAWGLAGLLVAPSRGLLVYSPALVLLPLGLWALCRNRVGSAGGLLLAWSAAAAGTVLFYAKWYDWSGGWCFGPRFLCEILPICCLLFALGYAALRSRWSQRVARVLIGLSVAVQVVGMMGHSAETDWCLRHEMSDQGRSLFAWRDTQIEAYARAMLWAGTKHFN
jgi:hypothetical protein